MEKKAPPPRFRRFAALSPPLRPVLRSSSAKDGHQFLEAYQVQDSLQFVNQPPFHPSLPASDRQRRQSHPSHQKPRQNIPRSWFILSWQKLVCGVSRPQLGHIYGRLGIGGGNRPVFDWFGGGFVIDCGREIGTSRQCEMVDLPTSCLKYI